MTNYKIHVTSQDIQLCRYARQGDPNRCMIADAVQRAIPRAMHICVDERYIRFSLERTQKRYFYNPPKIAVQAIIDFDAGRVVAPFTFTIRRGYSERRRSKMTGFVPSSQRYNPTGRRRQPKRKREFGLCAFSDRQAQKILNQVVE